MGLSTELHCAFGLPDHYTVIALVSAQQPFLRFAGVTGDGIAASQQNERIDHISKTSLVVKLALLVRL